MNDRIEPAPIAAVRTIAQQLLDTLPALSRKRLETLIGLMDDEHRINYATAYERLFPKASQGAAEKGRADKAFNKFRDSLKRRAADRSLVLELRVDQNRNADPNLRHLWFVVEDDSKGRLRSFNEGEIQSRTEHVIEPTLSVRDTEATYLLYYAAKEKDEAHRLHNALRTELKTRGCKWEALDYHHVLPGDKPEETHAGYLSQADFVLYFVSAEMISALMDDPLPTRDHQAIPLCMKPVTPEQLANTLLAGAEVATDEDRRAWNDRKGPKREAWISTVASAVIDRYEELSNIQENGLLNTKVRIRAPHDCQPEHFVEPNLKRIEDKEGQRALPFLQNWLKDPEGSVLCAIFGELGSGKTTLCQQLTEDLMDLYNPDGTSPFPVYLDLRSVNSMGWDWSKGDPPLDDILQHILDEAYNLPEGVPKPTVDDVKRLAQNQGGLVVFDGLDEVMNRLTPEQCLGFIRSLLKVLPPIIWKGAEPRPPGCGRLLMTCRSHFFQTLQDQIGALCGRQRDAVTKDDYLWGTLLPFTREQIEQYLRQVCRDDPGQAARAIEMLDQVHNLGELSTRPYNLRLIQGQVERLEAIRRRGEKIDIADLYEGIVEQWTDRDKPKHRLKREHKLLLMERLALRLWRGRDKSVDYEDLEEWLLDELTATPRWQLNYSAYINQQGGLDILQEDLRNASFLVREGEQRFRFAHTSIMEFFLARALHRALVKDELEQWAIPLPSKETLDFLGGLITGRDREACLAGLAGLRGRYRKDASELAFSYALCAYEQGYPGAVFEGFQLQGAALTNLRLAAREGEVIHLRGADLRDARLDDGHFVRVDLREARLDRARLDRCLLEDCDLAAVSGRGADLTGTVFHHCTGTGADLRDARTHRTQWIALDGHTPPRGLDDAPPGVFLARQRNRPTSPAQLSYNGDGVGVSALAWHPEGRWLLSGGGDGAVRFIDPDSHEIFRVLEGHVGAVQALVVDHQGRWFVSGDASGHLRVWELNTGALLHTMKKEPGAIRALAVHPDGEWIVSACAAGPVRLWNPESGKLIRCLGTESKNASAVAVHPGGRSRWIATGHSSGQVKLFRTDSGELLRTLEGHSSRVSTLAFDPEGRWLASGEAGGYIRIWSLPTGKLLNHWEAHEHYMGALVALARGGGLVSAGFSSLRFWNPKTGKPVARAKRLNNHFIPTAAFAVHPEEKWLSWADFEGTIVLQPLASNVPAKTMKHQHSTVNSAVILPRSGRVTYLGADGGVRHWGAGTDRPKLFSPAISPAPLNVLGCHPEEDWIAVGDFSTGIHLVAPNSGAVLRSLQDKSAGWTLSVAVHPRGRWLATGHPDGSVRLWDPSSGELLRSLGAGSGNPHCLAIHPEGTRIATAGEENQILLWDPESAELERSIKHGNGTPMALVFGPEVDWLASTHMDPNGSIRLWAPESGDLLRSLPGHVGWINALTVHPKGQWIASGDDAGNVVLQTPETGERLASLQVHGPVERLSCHPTGEWLLVSTRNRLLIWRPRLDGAQGDDGVEVGLQGLPGGNWVVWRHPLDPKKRRWLHHSPGAWRWLGWHAPLPDGEGWTRYPMDYFRDEEPSEE